MQIRNAMETVVKASLAEILQQKEAYGVGDICTCERCQLDTMALALNKLPPRYVVCDKGEAYARASALDQQFKVDTLFAVLNALQIVQSNPRH